MSFGPIGLKRASKVPMLPRIVIAPPIKLTRLSHRFSDISFFPYRLVGGRSLKFRAIHGHKHPSANNKRNDGAEDPHADGTEQPLRAGRFLPPAPFRQ